MVQTALTLYNTCFSLSQCQHKWDVDKKINVLLSNWILLLLVFCRQALCPDGSFPLVFFLPIGSSSFLVIFSHYRFCPLGLFTFRPFRQGGYVVRDLFSGVLPVCDLIHRSKKETLSLQTLIFIVYFINVEHCAQECPGIQK